MRVSTPDSGRNATHERPVLVDRAFVRAGQAQPQNARSSSSSFR